MRKKKAYFPKEKRRAGFAPFVPLCGHGIFENALSINPQWKLKNGTVYFANTFAQVDCYASRGRIRRQAFANARRTNPDVRFSLFFRPA